MIQPTKLLNLDLCVLRVSSLILKVLQKKRLMTYEDLVKKLSDQIDEDAHFVFIPSVEFLFLLGKIEYHTKTDSFELLKNSKVQGKK